MAPSQNATSVGLTTLRLEFILECFRRLKVENVASVYRLADIWAIPPDEVRLVHAMALMERDRDDLLEDIIPLVEDVARIIDCVTDCIRRRIGDVIAILEKLPSYARHLSVVDAAALQWAREGADPPSAALIQAVMDGRTSPIVCNLPSTRHLIIRMHSLLLANPPSASRSGLAASGGALPSDTTGITAGVDVSLEGAVEEKNNVSISNSPSAAQLADLKAAWECRKDRCDALLGLCTAFARIAQFYE
jgi:hypothetical protein